MVVAIIKSNEGEITMSEYGNLEAGQNSDYFMVHMSAMTSEKLHSKGDIAGELAYRDQRIAELEAVCTEYDRMALRSNEVNSRLQSENAKLVLAASRAKVLLDAATYHDGRYEQHTDTDWQKKACAISKTIGALLEIEQ